MAADRWTPLVVGTGAHWSVEAWRDRFYVVTDDGAPRGRVYAVDPARPARKSWREIVPERPDATIAGASRMHWVVRYFRRHSMQMMPNR